MVEIIISIVLTLIFFALISIQAHYDDQKWKGEREPKEPKSSPAQEHQPSQMM